MYDPKETCKTCVHSSPATYNTEKAKTPTGYYFCERKEPWRLSVCCNIGQYHRKPVRVSGQHEG